LTSNSLAAESIPATSSCARLLLKSAIAMKPMVGRDLKRFFGCCRLKEVINDSQCSIIDAPTKRVNKTLARDGALIHAHRLDLPALIGYL
jgi:hypothetical protein